MTKLAVNELSTVISDALVYAHITPNYAATIIADGLTDPNKRGWYTYDGGMKSKNRSYMYMALATCILIVGVTGLSIAIIGDTWVWEIVGSAIIVMTIFIAIELVIFKNVVLNYTPITLSEIVHLL
jgi:hypothetical protein